MLGSEMSLGLPFTNDQWGSVPIPQDNLTSQVRKLLVPASALSSGGPHQIQLSCSSLSRLACWCPRVGRLPFSIRTQPYLGFWDDLNPCLKACF